MSDQKDKSSAYKYRCKECGMLYQTQELRDACAKWCREHKSCNLEIIKHGKAPEELNGT